MKIKFLIFGGTLLALAACSHSPKMAEFKVPENYQSRLYQEVGADLIAESKALRAPANDVWQVKTLKANLGDLNRVKPGKFEIYVFPKIQTMNHKEISQDESILLGKPQVSEVSVLAVMPCDAFINKEAFAKYHPKKYFDGQLGANKKNSCAIVEVTSREMKNLNRDLLREGDVLSKRLYLNSDYNVYGIETDFFSSQAQKSEGNVKTVGMKMESGSPSTSGLDFLPVDLPAFSRLEKLEDSDARKIFSSGKATDFSFKADGTLVDAVAVRQITRLNKNFKAPSCSLKKMSYKDHYRKSVEMYWCEGMPWPQVVDSAQFVAVTQNLSVRSAQ